MRALAAERARQPFPSAPPESTRRAAYEEPASAPAGRISERARTVWSAYRGSGDPLATARALRRGMAEVELALKMNRLRGESGDEAGR